MTSKPHIFDLDRNTLHQLITQWGLAPYRADQILHWVYRRQTADFHQMLNISLPDRQTLSRQLQTTAGEIVHHQLATDGVQKLLVQWDNDSNNPQPNNAKAHQSECVMIPSISATSRENNDNTHRQRRTACISSQIGCPVGCTFCASGLGGLDANLSAGQIVEQAWRLGTLQGVERITHIVFMGMGEPLANYDQVIRAIRTLTADWGMGISARRITISTVGLPTQIKRLTKLEIPVTLAISLHAPDDHLRRRLIPWAKHVSIEQIMDAAREYFSQTGREVTLEYTLLRGVNDQSEHAHRLAKIANTLRANVNLIRYNEVATLPFDRPTTTDVHRFQAILQEHAVNTHIRASRGRDIAAACGQLRHEHASTQPAPLHRPMEKAK